MKRRISYALAALAVMGTFALGSPGGASADEEGCAQLDWAISYHAGEGNIAYALQLGKWAEANGCDVTRNRTPWEDPRLIA